MSAPSTNPYDWLKTVPSGLIAIDEVPLIGHAPPFPWQKLVNGIIKQFELDKLVLSPSNWTWRSGEELFTGLSNEPFLVHLGLAGYEGRATVALGTHDLTTLVSFLLTHRTIENSLFDPPYEKAFLQFLTLVLCDHFSNLGWEKGAQLYILAENPLPQTPHLTLDIQVELSIRSFTVRVFLDEVFRQSWKEKHLAPFDVALNPSMAKNIELPASVEAGHIQMTFREWKKVCLGDFLFLDSCTIDETARNGSLLIRAHHLPYYKAELNEGNIILTEQPSYHEIESAMPKNISHDDSDFDFDEESEVEEDSDFDFSEESEDSDSDFDFSEESDFSEISEVEEEETETQSGESQAAAPAPSSTQPAPKKSDASSSQPRKPPTSGSQVDIQKKNASRAASPQDIPLYIAIEVARFQMTLEKMLELQPGNLLNLAVRPEDGVDLVVNGRRIAKGELIRLGETLGVRVTEIS